MLPIVSYFTQSLLQLTYYPTLHSLWYLLYSPPNALLYTYPNVLVSTPLMPYFTHSPTLLLHNTLLHAPHNSLPYFPSNALLCTLPPTVLLMLYNHPFHTPPTIVLVPYFTQIPSYNCPATQHCASLSNCSPSCCLQCGPTVPSSSHRSPSPRCLETVHCTYPGLGPTLPAPRMHHYPAPSMHHQPAPSMHHHQAPSMHQPAPSMHRVPSSSSTPCCSESKATPTGTRPPQYVFDNGASSPLVTMYITILLEYVQSRAYGGV